MALFKLFESLTKAKRFDQTIMFLEDGEIAQLRGVFGAMAAADSPLAGGASAAAVRKLASQFGA
jgi:hypothetical protein